jgi:CoA:oxalate CoA-transferase
MSALPLDGITILDFSRFLAGPFATSLLGDMGATVIKVERREGGDEMRHTDRVFGPAADAGSYFIGANRSKRSMTLDVTKPEGRDIALRLAARSDVLLHNFRPGVVERLGLDYTSVAAVRPDIIYVSISSFGETGPLAAKPGMDLIVQAMGGVMGLTGDPAYGPTRVGAPVADYTGAFLACNAVLLGLFVRQRTGIGQKIEVPLINGQVAMLANYVPGFFVTGEPSGPVGNSHPQIVPYQTFRTRDNDLVVACLTEQFWRNLCDVLGMPELKTDPRFRRNPDRVQHRAELIPILQARFLERSSREWTALLEAADVPCARVATLADLVQEPQIAHNEMLVEIAHPVVGPVRVVGVPIKLYRTPGRIRGAAPLLGEATDELLRELGYTDRDIADLRARRIV